MAARGAYPNVGLPSVQRQAQPARVSPERIGQLVAQYAAQNGADPLVLLAVIDVESGFNNLAVGDFGTSFGLFQHHVGGAGGPTKETARQYLDAAKSIEERSRALAGVTTGAGAAAVQRPANRAAYARKVDDRLKKMRTALQAAPVGAGSTGGAKSSPLRDELRRIATASPSRGGFGLRHSSGNRSTRLTSDGNVSDHWAGQTSSWADDYAGPTSRMQAFERYAASRGDLKQVLGPLSRPSDHSDHVHVAGYSSSGGTQTVGWRENVARGALVVPGIGSALSAALNAARGGKAIADGAGAAKDAAGDLIDGAKDAVSGAIESAVNVVVRSGAVLLLVALGGLLVIIGVVRATGAASREGA